LIYYKIAKVIAGQSNSALITETGDLLMHGMNEQGQLGVGDELGKALVFFGDFMKKDFFYSQGLQVLDVSYGSFHTLVLCREKASGKQRVFACGQSEYGQLGLFSKLITYGMVEISDMFPTEVSQISAGSFHSLFVTKDDKLYGCGRNNKGQLGFRGQGVNPKVQAPPVEIKVPLAEKGFKVQGGVKRVYGGSLYSMALCRTAEPEVK
jgi:alpha-tubulin suppressor-like RCC1 family protein